MTGKVARARAFRPVPAHSAPERKRMGLGNLLGRLFGSKGLDVDELARRLGMAADDLRKMQPAYSEFTIPKRAGEYLWVCYADAEDVLTIRPLSVYRDPVSS